jgi:hypothetical protein
MASNGVQCSCLEMGDCVHYLGMSQNPISTLQELHDAPVDLQFELIDKFRCRVFKQGPGKNENQWAHKGVTFPICTSFGLALVTAIMTCANLIAT